MERCIQDCLDCYRSCLETISHCLELGGRHAERAHITLLQDCAEICVATAGWMLRQSELHPRLAAICAEVCESCADSCEQIDADDSTMKACADMCRRCADSCRQLMAA
jgi:hypothetical protein